MTTVATERKNFVTRRRMSRTWAMARLRGTPALAGANRLLFHAAKVWREGGNKSLCRISDCCTG
ncbi:hypothetical protein ACX3P5_01000 [Pantoea sp. S-LA4]